MKKFEGYQFLLHRAKYSYKIEKEIICQSQNIKRNITSIDIVNMSKDINPIGTKQISALGHPWFFNE